MSDGDGVPHTTGGRRTILRSKGCELLWPSTHGNPLVIVSVVPDGLATSTDMECEKGVAVLGSEPGKGSSVRTACTNSSKPMSAYSSRSLEGDACSGGGGGDSPWGLADPGLGR